MNLFKKLMTGAAVGALTLAVAGGVGSVSADAATATFAPATQTMTVSGDGAEVMVSFDAIKLSKNAETWNANAKWDVYDGTEATVDLSSLKVAKDMYIAVKDNTSAKPNVYKIPADTTKLAGKYEMVTASKTSKLTFTDNKEALDTAKTKLEYRTENANAWTEYKEASFKIAMYEQQGATLYFRKKAVNMTATAPEEENAEAEYVMNTVAGNFASKEVKVKVTKMANAPSATIDYDAGTFKLKAGTEYRQVDESGAFVAPAEGEAGDFTAADATKPLAINVTKAGAVEVRTAATEKKVASKIAVYAYKAVAKPAAANVITGEAKAADNKLNIQYGKDKKGNDQVTLINGNKNATYVVYTVDPATAEKPKAIATLKPAESKGYKDVTLAAAKVEDGSKLYFVTASDKKAGIFRSTAQNVTITYPKAEEPDEPTE